MVDRCAFLNPTTLCRCRVSEVQEGAHRVKKPNWYFDVPINKGYRFVKRNGTWMREGHIGTVNFVPLYDNWCRDEGEKFAAHRDRITRWINAVTNEPPEPNTESSENTPVPGV